MRRLGTCIAGLGLLSMGYLLGTSQHVFESQAYAQVDDNPLAEASANKVRAVNLALAEAIEELKQDERYQAATEGMNAFLVLTGGGHAIDDLEAGNGVDPETFAGLYAGLAAPEVAEHISRDAEGRIMYKDKIVRLYPVDRLKKVFAERTKLVATDL